MQALVGHCDRERSDRRTLVQDVREIGHSALHFENSTGSRGEVTETYIAYIFEVAVREWLR